MVNIELTPTELAMVIQRVDRYPTHISSMEQNLVAKLREAVPSPSTEVPLTKAQLERIFDWYSWAENEGGASSHGDEADELLRVLRETWSKL